MQQQRWQQLHGNGVTAGDLDACELGAQYSNAALLHMA